MAKLAGHKSLIKCSGTAVAFVGEAVTTSDNQKYQITDSAKRVLGNTSTISVHKRSSTGETAEAGTTTTNITITGHGLVTGDLIVNTTRSNAKRIITRVDDDNFTVASVSSQTTGDSIDLYPTEDASGYTLNRLSGYAEYDSATSRTILISGEYLPLTTIGEAYEFSLSLSANNEDVSVFSNTYVEREQTLKDVTLSISDWYVDYTYQDKLTDGSPLVIELFVDSSGSFECKLWCLLSSDEVSSSVDGIVEESLELEGTLDADSRAITFD